MSDAPATPRSASATDPVVQPGSSSLAQPDYWWYRARSVLLETVLRPYLGTPSRVLDVGSADGPSVGWMRGDHRRTTMDIVPRGLVPGEGVCGSATDLPFASAAFEVVSAFDVVEHCEDDRRAVAELTRVLRPGGRLLLSVPAYQWAWSEHDVRAGHYRRYTRPALVRLVEDAGLTVLRSTYAFTSVFPFFVAERALREARRRTGRMGEQRLTPVSPGTDRLLMRLSALDARLLRRRDLPFGSSVFLAAVKPGPGA
jgi:SAM-dependent methyltransferase